MPKQKTYRCRHCGHQTDQKADNWQHIKTHVKPEKLLSCNACQFVTEYKHHLEYHQRNHAGIKPFKCEKCNYQCVNMSMLKSHMKSHSSLCPYQCGDCKYATKYAHSLKMHLKKYNHHANDVLVIDVYSFKKEKNATNSNNNGATSTSPASSTTTTTSTSLSLTPTSTTPTGQPEQQCILDLRIDSKLQVENLISDGLKEEKNVR